MATFGWHQHATATPVDPTWQQAVVTINDETMVAAAQQWAAPFPIRFAATGADIRVTRERLPASVGGEATKTTDGNRITGCSIIMRPEMSTAVMAHEVGHCLGLHHDNDHPESLMYWISGGGATGVTDRDRMQLAILYAR